MICSGSQYFYKHQHFHSYTTNHSKRGALIGTWTRMQDNTMDDSHLQTCIQEKMLELSTLSYPHKYVQHTLQYMHKKTGNHAWLAFWMPLYIYWKNLTEKTNWLGRDYLIYFSKRSKALTCPLICYMGWYKWTCDGTVVHSDSILTQCACYYGCWVLLVSWTSQTPPDFSLGHGKGGRVAMTQSY